MGRPGRPPKPRTHYSPVPLYCLDCGKQRSSKSYYKKEGRCADCYHKYMAIKPPRGVPGGRPPRLCKDCGTALGKHSAYAWGNGGKYGDRNYAQRCVKCAALFRVKKKRLAKRSAGDYVGADGKHHLNGVEPAWGALRKAWWGFRIAKWNEDAYMMAKYAEKINELQDELGLDRYIFHI